MSIEGIDISSYQPGADLRRVASAGKVFCVIKDADGLKPTATFAAQWVAAKAAGMLRAAYDFLRPELDGAAQAKFFLDRLNGDPGELAPWLDVEVEDGRSPAQVLDDIEAWLDLVSAYAGRPVIYTGPAFWAVLRAADRARADAISGRTDLAVAAYGPASAPHVGAWPAPKFWQYSGTGRCDGVAGNCDLDRWLGTLDELRAYAAGWRRPGGEAAYQAGELVGPPEASLIVSSSRS